ncbi:hypothetical protein LX36DRAFT_37042 [Colletotrichum falcatum]|nr:hypothetical protein LX36DRAFT_37042 [Colletotrichum falcatum]
MSKTSSYGFSGSRPRCSRRHHALQYLLAQTISFCRCRRKEHAFDLAMVAVSDQNLIPEPGDSGRHDVVQRSTSSEPSPEVGENLTARQTKSMNSYRTSNAGVFEGMRLYAGQTEPSTRDQHVLPQAIAVVRLPSVRRRSTVDTRVRFSGTAHTSFLMDWSIRNGQFGSVGVLFRRALCSTASRLILDVFSGNELEAASNHRGR